VAPEDASADDLTEILRGGWSHAHEQDQGDDQVFVPSDTPLPPSRGRDSFTLGDGGAASTTGPGADDRHVTSEASWDLDGRRLKVYLGPGRTLLYDIKSATPGRLVLRPVSDTS
jgi:hypothetical protein